MFPFFLKIVHLNFFNDTVRNLVRFCPKNDNDSVLRIFSGFRFQLLSLLFQFMFNFSSYFTAIVCGKAPLTWTRPPAADIGFLSQFSFGSPARKMLMWLHCLHRTQKTIYHISSITNFGSWLDTHFELMGFNRT